MNPLKKLLLSFVSLVVFARADFWVYLESRGGVRYYKFLDNPETNCNKIQEIKGYPRINDVSGTKHGFRNVGDELDPDILEFNTDIGHYTIYKDRDLTMVDLDDQVQGQCYLRNTNKYYCSSCWLCWDRGNSIFWCDTMVGTEGIKLLAGGTEANATGVGVIENK